MRRILFIMLLLLALAGCGAAKIDPAALAKESADAFDKVETFHFDLVVSDGTPAPIDTGSMGLILQTAQGDIKRPQQISGSLKAKAEGIPLSLEMNVIILGEEAYITNPLDPGKWEALGEDSASLTSFSPAKGVSDVLRGLKELEAKGEETIDGVKTQHIVGKADTTTMAPLTGGATMQGTVQVEAWIGIDDKLPRRMVAVGQLDPAEPATIKRTLTLGEFGKSVTIEAPK